MNEYAIAIKAPQKVLDLFFHEGQPNLRPIFEEENYSKRFRLCDSDLSADLCKLTLAQYRGLFLAHRPVSDGDEYKKTLKSVLLNTTDQFKCAVKVEDFSDDDFASAMCLALAAHHTGYVGWSDYIHTEHGLKSKIRYHRYLTSSLGVATPEENRL